ncbi:MAG: hydrogenase maturation protease [Burkholderiaceae bacterium]|nr:hydrogenase maturation protease [Rhodoferax sp.]MCP5284110.1 hydrogenase maturation protease [Burkholderiaceae bacterium]
MTLARVLVIAVGNPSRGDDGLGPMLVAQWAVGDMDGVEVLTDFQLQVEHALDLLACDAVLFVDATREAVGVELHRVEPAAALPVLSHALTPAGVLHVAQRLGQRLPDAWQLAIEGTAFGLGEGLSSEAQARLVRGLEVASAWLAQRRRIHPSTACIDSSHRAVQTPEPVVGAEPGID